MAGQRAGGVLSEVQGDAFTLVSADSLRVYYILLPLDHDGRVFLHFLLMYLTISPLKARTCRKSRDALMPPAWVAWPLRGVMTWDGLRGRGPVRDKYCFHYTLCNVDRAALALRALFPFLHGMGGTTAPQSAELGWGPRGRRVSTHVSNSSKLYISHCYSDHIQNYRLSVVMQSWQ